MENWWKALLFLAVSTAANAIPLQRQTVQDEAIAVAIDIYNEQQSTSSVYRRVKDDPSMDQPTFSAQLRFRIKETVCSKSDKKKNPEECDFKEDGIVKDCTASSTGEQKVICETSPPTNTYNGPTQTDKGGQDTGKEGETGKKKKSDNWFMNLLNKFLELIGLKEAGDDSEPFCFTCIFDMFSQ
nr:cathelicidin family antimicrobial peptide TK-CATH precursor [Tylototriton kweichowensis]